ncbi:MAG TPA: efflux RND transporter periplasmic adaptor subunit, partial [Candidatus Methylomirabilis sp.]|nr:efflux RND transporter periplasmic adaptor subunit [Candidatus Methylomirabilis sp.]
APAPRRRGGGWLAVIVLMIAAVALGVIIYRGIEERRRKDADLVRAAAVAAVTTVAVVHPKAEAPAEELILPGTAQAFTDSPIYARASGYLRHWYVDIGARVTQGQLLAEIETPELHQQLHQARADLDTALANLELARTTAARWQSLLKTESVSQQETDEKVSDHYAKQATMEAYAANVRRLEDLLGFQKIYAPFDGVITRRNTDIGALIDAGSNALGRELFRLAAIHTLRVFVSVPQVYAQTARPGTRASITLDEMPGRVFSGSLVRTANAIDPSARTLLVEVDVANPDGVLLPGAYLVVHLHIDRPIRAVTIPANTLLFRAEGLHVGLVRGDHAELVAVKIGRDYGREVEIVSGLRPSDTVILDPPDSLVTGTPVRLVEPKREPGRR